MILALSEPMKTVIIVSRCLRIIKMNPAEFWFEFHFNGVCAGEKLKKVILKGRPDFHIAKGEEYLLYVQMLSLEQGVLKAIIVKLKKLDECWDRS
jgi:hypothetical protein